MAKRVPVALQVYTIRDVGAQDFPRALRYAAEIGYDGVELGGLHGMTAQALRQQLADLGLGLAGNHADLAALENNLPDVIAANQLLGSRFITLSYIPEERRRTLDGWRDMAGVMNRVGAEIKKAGMQFCYHNHAFEFEKFDGKYGLDWLYELTDPDLVKAELDTYWVQYGGASPAAYVQKYAGRLALLHIKDMERGSERFFAEIGEGVLDWPAIFAAAEAGAVQWYIVEQDDWRRASVDAARLSFTNLKKMGKTR